MNVKHLGYHKMNCKLLQTLSLTKQFELVDFNQKVSYNKNPLKHTLVILELCRYSLYFSINV